MILLWILACSDRGFSLVREDPLDAEPDIKVEPGSVGFDPVAVGCVADRLITITNVGKGPLDVSKVWPDALDEAGNDYGVEDLQATVKPGESESVRLQFQPSFVWDATAEVVIESDDPDSPEVRVPVAGSSFDPTWYLDVFEQQRQKIDVLWVIDNSGSMHQERDRVTTEISEFFRWFTDLDLDYHMGVVTTDVVNPVYSGQLVGTPSFVTRDTPDPEGTLSRAIQVGGIEMGDEAGLQAMEMAITEPLRSGANEGFYRDDAKLAVIFLTDEDDQSIHEAAWYISFLDGLKADRDDIFVAAIVGDRGDGCQNVCADGPQEAKDGEKYLDVAAAFGGFEESICTCDLAPAMEQMGFESTYYVRSFPLTQEPGAPSMLKVWVDGEERGGWTYDSVENAIVFDLAPLVGSEIVVRYPVQDPCAP